ncbi:MAG TPA: MFS transporter [Candidatus Marinimicrobia bacterium]|nr:MFS transporter [Candidatus Neomarinimicrobiota bacterium]
MSEQKRGTFRSFPPTYWLAVIMEFFERGSYYGMMSILSVYMTEKLGFAKESVGLIKGTIQPILYFLPIISGALADRFGYRRALTVAFTLLGVGYLITSQMTSYAAVFLALCIMALGAGTFKPIISGTIARVTDKSNSSLGFGIFYWSINLGAFLFPMFLVPFLKSADPSWRWVIIASAIGTGIMLIPTFFLYKEPPMPERRKEHETDLLQTIANAFEIIYSPIVLLFLKAQSALRNARLIYGITGLLALLAIYLLIAKNSFFLLYITLLTAGCFFILNVKSRCGIFKACSHTRAAIMLLLVGGLILWLLPGLTLYSRIVTSVIFLTVFALFKIDSAEPVKFVDYFKFLLLICIYSGFWVLYFQMFDSVLWYVNDYVDAASLDNAVNRMLAFLGIGYVWHFDIEHVTVINALTIIILQIFISMLVKNTKALPTMMVAIGLGTLGMAILAINTSIWVFMAGIVIFSIGEMTAHPKFISYIGQTAPKERLATFMGYIFLYGVIGSSIGAIVGAKLYVHFVDGLQQPRTLWLIFSLIGVVTIIGLFLYNKFLTPKESE